ncbi:hypothetical protein ABKN59_009050 [Abortiporus biennis]
MLLSPYLPQLSKPATALSAVQFRMYIEALGKYPNLRGLTTLLTFQINPFGLQYLASLVNSVEFINLAEIYHLLFRLGGTYFPQLRKLDLGFVPLLHPLITRTVRPFTHVTKLQLGISSLLSLNDIRLLVTNGFPGVQDLFLRFEPGYQHTSPVRMLVPDSYMHRQTVSLTSLHVLIPVELPTAQIISASVAKWLSLTRTLTSLRDFRGQGPSGGITTYLSLLKRLGKTLRKLRLHWPLAEADRDGYDDYHHFSFQNDCPALEILYVDLKGFWNIENFCDCIRTGVPKCLTTLIVEIGDSPDISLKVIDVTLSTVPSLQNIRSFHALIGGKGHVYYDVMPFNRIVGKFPRLAQKGILKPWVQEVED